MIRGATPHFGYVCDTVTHKFQATRVIRHEIVHRGRRLSHQDRGRAQRAVDTGRWLYNKIEGNTQRARLRDYGVLKSAGRVATDTESVNLIGCAVRRRGSSGGERPSPVACRSRPL